MTVDLARDPKYRASRLRSLAQHTLGALGVNGDALDPATILEHSVYRACDELEHVEDVLGGLDETSGLISVIAGIRQRLWLAVDSGDLLAALLEDGEPAGESESEVTP